MLLSKSLGRLTATLILSLILAACGNPSGLSGTYEADMGGGGIRVEFQGGNKARVSLVGPPGEPEISHNTVYTTDGSKLHFTTDEPMGAPMDLVYEKGVLSDGMGMVFEKK
jgi:hypothetical protein